MVAPDVLTSLYRLAVLAVDPAETARTAKLRTSAAAEALSTAASIVAVMQQGKSYYRLEGGLVTFERGQMKLRARLLEARNNATCPYLCPYGQR